MERNWKNIVIFLLSIGLILSGIGNFFLIELGRFVGPLPPSRTLVVGTFEGPSELDPVNSSYWTSKDLIHQVCEGLYAYNLSDPNLGIIPRLAKDYWTWDLTGTRLTVPLRQNITFHDGTPFNAWAVKWNFERINWFMNGTGTLNTTISPFHSLWKFPNGTIVLDLLNPVTINSDYNVTINLSAPFSVIESLLCHESASILSPESTPKFIYLHNLYGRIVGTGPFVYDYYIANKEVTFHRWDGYWQDLPFFEEVTFVISNDLWNINYAMLHHSIDYLVTPISSLNPTFDADPTIILQTGIQGLAYYYIGMNNKIINRTWRQAISFAINYTYIIEDIIFWDNYRSNGPLAPNFPMYDPTIQAATYNLTKAREIVVSMGFGDMGWTDAQWIASDIQSWNYSHWIGNDIREDLLILLQDNLALIGIEIIDRGIGSWEWPSPFEPPDGWEEVNLYWMSSYFNYLSPYNMLFPLFSNKSTVNYFQYHNLNVEIWLDQVLSETNPVSRQALYRNILHQIVEVDMPHLFVSHPFYRYVHSADIHGVSYDALRDIYVYPMYRG